MSGSSSLVAVRRPLARAEPVWGRLIWKQITRSKQSEFLWWLYHCLTENNYLKLNSLNQQIFLEPLRLSIDCNLIY